MDLKKRISNTSRRINNYISNKITNLKRNLSSIKKYIPNTLTISRIVATPIIIISCISNNLPLTLFLTSYSFITDFLDGFLSRKWNVTSKLGAMLDQIADKILGIGSLLLSIYYVPILTINLILEGIISGINIKEKLKGKNPKTLFSGKVKTWGLSFTIISSLATKFIPNLINLASILSITTFIMQIVATIDYCIYYHKNKNDNNEIIVENIKQDDIQLDHFDKQKDKVLDYSKQQQIYYLTNLKHQLLHEETIKPKTKVKN